MRHTPIHERGAVLSGAAATLESQADALGLELSREEGKTLTEGMAEALRAAQILRYFAAEGNRAVGEHFASPRPGERILVTRKPLNIPGGNSPGSSPSSPPFNFPIAIRHGRSLPPCCKVTLHTPANIHYGHADVARKRSATLAAARAKHPERFNTTIDPKILALPGPAWINQPKENTEQSAA